jgi:hypothetical protein
MGLSIYHSLPGVRPRRVFLALPSYGEISGITAFSLFRAHPALLDAGFDVELGMLLGDCHVDDARNSLVADFLESGCDDLFFIDADVGFQNNDIIRLLNHDRDVVGGAYPKKSDNPEYPIWLKDGEIWSDRDGLIEVNGIATGFLRIRRRVLEDLAKTAQRYTTQLGRNVPMIFERLIIDGMRFSGDMAFCYKWVQAGGKVFADPDCYLEHEGNKRWSGTLGSHLRTLHGMALKTPLYKVAHGIEQDSDYLEMCLEWGNDGFAAGSELLKACVMVARQVSGSVLETGCGLSTLVIAAANPSLTVHALEHKWEWAVKVEQAAERLGLKNIVIHRTHLVDTPAGKWYDAPRLPWDDIQLVLCDGPPRKEGNRRILFGVMATHDCRPKCILVDDAETEGDSIPEDYRTEIKGQLRKFAVGLR